MENWQKKTGEDQSSINNTEDQQKKLKNSELCCAMQKHKYHSLLISMQIVQGTKDDCGGAKNRSKREKGLSTGGYCCDGCVHNGAEFKNKRICPMDAWLIFNLQIRNRVSHRHICSTVIALYNMTH